MSVLIFLMAQYSWTPLLVATSGNFTDVVLLLLDHKPNVNATDKDGFTPLAIACKIGNNVMVKALLSCGTYVNLTDKVTFPPNFRSRLALRLRNLTCLIFCRWETLA